MNSQPAPTKVLQAYFDKIFNNPVERKEPVVVVGMEREAPDLAVANAAKVYTKSKGAKLLLDDEIDRAAAINMNDDVVVINAPLHSISWLLDNKQDTFSVGKKGVEAKRRLDKVKDARHVILNMVDSTSGRKHYFNLGGPDEWNKTMEKLRDQYPNAVVIGAISCSSTHENLKIIEQLGQGNHVLQQEWTAAEFQDFATKAFPRAAKLGLLNMLDRRMELFEEPKTGDNGLTGPLTTSPRSWLAAFTDFEAVAGEYDDKKDSGELAMKIIRVAQIRLGSQVVEEIRQLPFAQNEAAAGTKTRMDTRGFLESLGLASETQQRARVKGQP